MISLPEEFSYLSTTALHYGAAWRFWSPACAPGRIERHAQAWSELAQTHQAICKGEDIVAIANWLRSPSRSTRQREGRRLVRGLLRLLERLGVAGVKPFDQPILRAPKPPALVTAGVKAAGGCDARALPPRLSYIIARAQRMGIRAEWDALGSYIDHISERRFNALVATADLMRRRGDDCLLRRWLIESQSQPDEAASLEARLARCLLHILDALEIF